MRCFGSGSDRCCQYYNDTMCVDECSGLLSPDENYNCVCPGFFNFPECTGTLTICIIHLCVELYKIRQCDNTLENSRDVLYQLSY